MELETNRRWIMSRIMSLLLVVMGLSGTTPLLAQEAKKKEKVISDGYNLYDRNREGLDWNRYNYPDSGQQRTDR